MNELLIRGFDALYARYAESSTYRGIFRDAFGAEYPEELAPLSFVTTSLLRQAAADLRPSPGARVLDLGCGQGGPGLWVAKELGASLVGLDLSRVAVGQARTRARGLGMGERAQFEVASMEALPFPDATFGGAVSIDALFMVPDKPAALRETARVLASGAAFVLTSWDQALAPPMFPPPVHDHRPLLEDAGFAVERYEVIVGGTERQRDVYRRYLASEQQLAEELGEEAVQALLGEAQMCLGLIDGTDYLAACQRIYVVARRR